MRIKSLLALCDVLYSLACILVCIRVIILTVVLYPIGDLFSCDPASSLAHCVSADMHMGKGIAVLFKKKFGGIPELKKQGKLHN